MRVGNNPNRLYRAATIRPVVLAVLTHLPHFEEYHAGREEVLLTCLKSMTEHANMDYSLAIWDNGSLPIVREMIKDEFHPDIFVESVNVGKQAGRTALTRILPPKTIVAYSDDDMYFYPGWLAPQIELLQHFPNVACVTGYPVRTSFRWGNTHTREWARANGKLEFGRFLPDQWEDDFAVSIGRDIQKHRDTSLADLDYRVTYNGKTAYCTSHHCQFVGYSDVVGRVVTWDGKAMGEEQSFDITLDSLGLRLATTERYTRHIGNVLHDELRKEISMQIA